ncbi:MAG TPA: hypothetical protein PL033_08960 [Candidatus Brocadiia bacterium]|nr:hypothetical protein [Candidatus Brocadiia bacterium]
MRQAKGMTIISDAIRLSRAAPVAALTCAILLSAVLEAAESGKEPASPPGASQSPRAQAGAVIRELESRSGDPRYPDSVAFSSPELGLEFRIPRRWAQTPPAEPGEAIRFAGPTLDGKEGVLTISLLTDGEPVKETVQRIGTQYTRQGMAIRRSVVKLGYNAGALLILIPEVGDAVLAGQSAIILVTDTPAITYVLKFMFPIGVGSEWEDSCIELLKASRTVKRSGAIPIDPEGCWNEKGKFVIGVPQFWLASEKEAAGTISATTISGLSAGGTYARIEITALIDRRPMNIIAEDELMRFRKDGEEMEILSNAADTNAARPSQEITLTRKTNSGVEFMRLSLIAGDEGVLYRIAFICPSSAADFYAGTFDAIRKTFAVLSDKDARPKPQK